MNSNNWSGGSYHTTLRDFFETYASSSDSAELADRLPDYLFRRSLTSPDEKFSVSRFIYSNPDADKRFDKKLFVPPSKHDTQKVSRMLYNTMKKKHYADEAYHDTIVSTNRGIDENESMSEEEKLYLYRKLLMQNKNEDHPSLVKHRRLMLDFQTRRDIARADNIVLPVPELPKEGLSGVQGKIVYLKNPVNRIRSTVMNRDSILPKKRQNEKMNTRPQTTPLRNQPTLVTLKPMTSMSKNNGVIGTPRRAKSSGNFTTKYRLMMGGNQKLFTKTNSLEFDIRNALNLNVQRKDNVSPNNIEKQDINGVDENVKSHQEPSTLFNSPTPPTPRLSLNIFIPREIEEVRMCNLPEFYDQSENLIKSGSVDISSLNRNVTESAKTTGFISSRYGLSRTTTELLSKCKEQKSQYPRFQYTQANLSSGIIYTKTNSIRTATDDPINCVQRQGNNTGNRFSKYNRPRHTISPTLRLDGRSSTFI